MEGRERRGKPEGGERKVEESGRKERREAESGREEREGKGKREREERKEKESGREERGEGGEGRADAGTEGGRFGLRRRQKVPNCTGLGGLYRQNKEKQGQHSNQTTRQHAATRKHMQ